METLEKGVNFQQISHLFLVFLLLTLNKEMFSGIWHILLRMSKNGIDSDNDHWNNADMWNLPAYRKFIHVYLSNFKTFFRRFFFILENKKIYVSPTSLG